MPMLKYINLNLWTVQIQEDTASEKYWHESEPTVYGHVVVSLLSSMAMQDWTNREFIIWVSYTSELVILKLYVKFYHRKIQ